MIASSSGEFFVQYAMQKIYHQGNRVNWFKLVWGDGNIPKYAFIYHAASAAEEADD